MMLLALQFPFKFHWGQESLSLQLLAHFFCFCFCFLFFVFVFFKRGFSGFVDFNLVFFFRDDSSDVAYAAVAQFESVSVEDFVESGFDLKKCCSIRKRKHFPTFVSMFLLYSGLNHVMFL